MENEVRQYSLVNNQRINAFRNDVMEGKIDYEDYNNFLKTIWTETFLDIEKPSFSRQPILHDRLPIRLYVLALFYVEFHWTTR